MLVRNFAVMCVFYYLAVSCDVGSNSITMGETQQLTTPVPAVDIVFVVEEKMCNRDIDRKMPALAKLMERSFSNKGYTDMRFGLVGFGGAGVHMPNHVHTMASKMFATRAEVSLGTSELVFSNGEYLKYHCVKHFFVVNIVNDSAN